MESELLQNLAEGNQVIIKEDKVKRTLKFSKGSKAPGPGGIPIELVKYGVKNVITFLMDRFNKILVEEGMLQEWNSAYICCIYKKGDKKDCHNYKGISIINYIERVFSKVMKIKTKNMIKATMSEEWQDLQQGGLF